MIAIKKIFKKYIAVISLILIVITSIFLPLTVAASIAPLPASWQASPPSGWSTIGGTSSYPYWALIEQSWTDSSTGTTDYCYIYMASQFSNLGFSSVDSGSGTPYFLKDAGDLSCNTYINDEVFNSSGSILMSYTTPATACETTYTSAQMLGNQSFNTLYRCNNATINIKVYNANCPVTDLNNNLLTYTPPDVNANIFWITTPNDVSGWSYSDSQFEQYFDLANPNQLPFCASEMAVTTTNKYDLITLFSAEPVYINYSTNNRPYYLTTLLYHTGEQYIAYEQTGTLQGFGLAPATSSSPPVTTVLASYQQSSTITAGSNPTMYQCTYTANTCEYSTNWDEGIVFVHQNTYQFVPSLIAQYAMGNTRSSVFSGTTPLISPCDTTGAITMPITGDFGDSIVTPANSFSGNNYVDSTDSTSGSSTGSGVWSGFSLTDPSTWLSPIANEVTILAGNIATDITPITTPINDMITWMPADIIALLGFGVVAVIVLRIFGR